jgi:peptide/nickel transport system ATP-binding protein
MEETTMNAEGERLLEVRNLRTSFFTHKGEVKAVNNVSFHLNKGEIVAIVGESGCGKSVLQMSIMQLVQSPPGKILGGEAIFDGQDILKYRADSKEMRAIRGAQIAMIFQEPMTALNPVFSVGSQLSEVIRVHMKVPAREAWKIGVEALASVGIPDPEERMKCYPFEMSGGMRQRVVIAVAIACRSKLIIADEPTTALDVTIQAQVMELLLGIVKQNNTSMIVVTHNLGLVSRYADRIYVMYAGQIVESGTTEEILTKPKHPYTLGLLKSVPNLDDEKGRKLVPIVGHPPNLVDLPRSCPFLPRCPYAVDKCNEEIFPIINEAGATNHFTACCRETEVFL